ncbi:thioredoxin family protein [Flavobacterium rhizosphaerae]|uniref:Thioredoxin family protein n=1 Tax=Flavobacterium rhizosphaerae TaxID=3163298 RepID=A0ABW8YVF8_9FLAO
MKKILLLLLVAFAAPNLQAQESELDWHTDISEAVSLSSKTQKPMMLFFTGSDWCGWCKKLEREVFFTPEFTKWAKDNVILVELDFPRSKPQSVELKQQNAQLNAFFKVRGYPTIWFVNGNENGEGKIAFEALGSTGYVAGGPEKWLAGANSIINKDKSTGSK